MQEDNNTEAFELGIYWGWAAMAIAWATFCAGDAAAAAGWVL